MASKIVNINTNYSDPVVAQNRNAIEHRAAWMGLIFDETSKVGQDAETITRKAIARRGDQDGARIAGNTKKPGCVASFAEAFLDDVGKSTFQMDIKEATDTDLVVEFHYCPLTAAWQKLGFDDERCATLCDLAMEGDRHIAKANGLTLDLTDTIAKGDPVCKLHFHK